jgi:hypothetical protein
MCDDEDIFNDAKAECVVWGLDKSINEEFGWGLFQRSQRLSK